MSDIVVYGAGYVGLVTAVCLAEIGHKVKCVEVNAAKVAALRGGIVPFYEPNLTPLLHKNQQNQRLHFSTNFKDTIAVSKVHIIAVGTPPLPDGGADLQYVFAVARQIATYSIADFIVVNKSTVPVGTADAVSELIWQQLTVQQKYITFSVVSNPEFLREGCAIQDFMVPDRIIVGAHDNNSITTLREIYQPITKHGVPLLTMDVRSAELTKYAANAMLATRISFINELSHIAELTNADIEQVSKGIGYDKRIGAHFIAAGCGYGGSCFPKDVSSLCAIARQASYYPQLITAVAAVNQSQKQVLFHKIHDYYHGALDNKTIAIWGLAFKPDTDDMREASSIDLITQLSKFGTTIQVYDPEAMTNARRIFADYDNIKYVTSAIAALNNAHCLVIVTEWQIFNTIKLQDIYQALLQPVIFDGRNIFTPQTMTTYGFDYISIGRSAVYNIGRLTHEQDAPHIEKSSISGSRDRFAVFAGD